MHGLLFNINSPIEFCITGKFDALTSSYIHIRRALNYSYELFVITKGTLYISYQGQKYAASAGQYLLMHPHDDSNNCQYGYRPSQVDFYWLHFTTPYAPQIISIDYNAPFQIENPNYIIVPDQGTLPNPDKVLVLLRHLQDYARSNYNLSAISHERKAVPKSPYVKPVIDYLSTTILCEIYSQECTQRLSEIAQDTASFKKRVYYSILDYIKENHSRYLKAQDVALKFGYNPKYLSSLFKSITGLSLKQYILQQKVEDANIYLSETELSISDIAFSLGFHDAHNFMKLYKKATGLTPTEYRNTFPKHIVKYDQICYKTLNKNF